MKEVETKAHVDFLQLRDMFAELECKYGKGICEEKKDNYYEDENGRLFRVRLQDGKYIYTHKESHTENGFESNNETEYLISKEKADWYEKNCKLVISKNKKGYLYRFKYNTYDANIELFEVEKLGFFLEIEVLLPDDCSTELEINSRNWIMKIIRHFNLEKKIETKKYMTLLREVN